MLLNSFEKSSARIIFVPVISAGQIHQIFPFDMSFVAVVQKPRIYNPEITIGYFLSSYRKTVAQFVCINQPSALFAETTFRAVGIPENGFIRTMSKRHIHERSVGIDETVHAAVGNLVHA